MELIVSNVNEYQKIFPTCKYSYNESWFHELNKAKVDEIKYFLFKTKKYKMGIVAGIKDNIMKFPYSAPFCIFEKKNVKISLEELEQTVKCLEKYCIENSLSRIIFRLPPSFYDETYISKIQNCLLRMEYEIVSMDLNYQFYLSKNKDIAEQMQRNAKKNLKIALGKEYSLEYCNDNIKKKKAYDIISINRKQKGYPLRMSWQQVSDTIINMKNDFWLLKLNDEYIASAVIFKVTDEVYQVIYWGDIHGYAEDKPMNYLAYKLYEYYAKKNMKVLDIGPSTEDGIPNYGLCKFKESIGCQVSNKLTFTKSLGGIK